ncbi:hypothetical protein CY35_04G004700 [Sphagnum magellanicum]|nr:hypothetical protein CY35_04G004700 [Sphagnum magellanicum]
MSATLNVPAAALFQNEDFDDGAITFADTPLPQKMKFAGKRAAILGIGALSSTYVVILSSRGFEINVWGNPAHRTQYNAMKAHGSVATGTSVKGSFRVTFCDELEDALPGATMVFATTPTYALHRLFIDMKALYDGPLRSDVATFTHLFLVPSCMEAPGARLVFGADYPKRIFEVSSATITAKWDAPAAVTHIKKMKRSLEVACLGGLQKDEIDDIKKFFVNDEVTEQSMLEIFMNSPGSRIHQMGIVAGLDIIQSRHADPSARYYRDVIASPAVGTLINNFEDDLFRIATKWGITPKPIVQWFNDTYPPP